MGRGVTIGTLVAFKFAPRPYRDKLFIYNLSGVGEMRQFRRLARLGAVLAFLGLGACVTVPGDEYFYYASSESQLKDADLTGSRFWIVHSRDPSYRNATPQERDALIAELTLQAEANGLISVQSVEEADYVFIFTPSYKTITINRTVPVYEGGERYSVEVEREVAHYDHHGNYLGTHRVRDIQYRRTPRYLTGTKRVQSQIVGPTAYLTVLNSADNDPEFDYDHATAEDIPTLVEVVSTPITDGVTFASHGRCLISGLMNAFPTSDPGTVNRIADLAECVLPVVTGTPLAS